MPTDNYLQGYLDRRISQPTVILCFRILLQNVILKGADAGMTTIEVSHEFNKEAKAFGIQRFRTDYMLRQTGKGNEAAIYENKGKFYLKPEILEGLSKRDLKNVIDTINQRYSGLGESRNKLYKEITDAQKLDVAGRSKFILNMLLDKETEKKGQCFEVTAFAILKVFYSIRGFELNRFSTIYSNDGGIDYTSQTSIYQVTTALSDAKFAEDLAKAPLKNRIFVYKKVSPGFDFSKMDNDLVSDYISPADLENHLSYLLTKQPVRNSQLIIDVILQEFKREHYV